MMSEAGDKEGERKARGRREEGEGRGKRKWSILTITSHKYFGVYSPTSMYATSAPPAPAVATDEPKEKKMPARSND